MRRLKIGDRLLRLRDEGDDTYRAYGPPVLRRGPRKTPLVLIHGAGSSSVLWMDAVRRYKDRRRVIAPDLPGHGQSDPWHDASIEVYRDAVGTVCATLGIDRAFLVGHSMGGQVALACAAAWPERVAGVVLVATGLRVSGPARTGPAAEWLRTVCWSPATPRELVERWHALVFSAEPELLDADLRAAGRFDPEPLAARTRSPTLVIGGADDLVTPVASVQALSRAIPGAELALLPRSGHLPSLEDPDGFYRLLDQFLALRS
jgi:pimeloyl-ACP methyl ester carboxylesterase